MLFIAAAEDNAGRLMEWVDAGNSLNVRDANGNTLIMTAIANENSELAVELIRHSDIDLKAHNKDGMTALHFAVLNDDKAAVKELLHEGAKPDAKDNKGETAASYASILGDNETATLIHDYQHYPKSQKHKIDGGRRKNLKSRGTRRRRQ